MKYEIVSCQCKRNKQQQFQNPGTYSVDFYCSGNLKIGDNGNFTEDYPLEEWRMFDNAREYEIEVNSFNKVIKYPNPVPEK